MTTPDTHVVWLGIAGAMGLLCYALGYSQRAMERLARKRKRKHL